MSGIPGVSGVVSRALQGPATPTTPSPALPRSAAPILPTDPSPVAVPAVANGSGRLLGSLWLPREDVARPFVFSGKERRELATQLGSLLPHVSDPTRVRCFIANLRQNRGVYEVSLPERQGLLDVLVNGIRHLRLHGDRQGVSALVAVAVKLQFSDFTSKYAAGYQELADYFPRLRDGILSLFATDISAKPQASLYDPAAATVLALLLRQLQQRLQQFFDYQSSDIFPSVQPCITRAIQHLKADASLHLAERFVARFICFLADEILELFQDAELLEDFRPIFDELPEVLSLVGEETRRSFEELLSR